MIKEDVTPIPRQQPHHPQGAGACENRNRHGKSAGSCAGKERLVS